MATPKTRIKAAALTAGTPQSIDECASAIARLGDTQRERQRLTTEMNDNIAQITERYQPRLEELGGFLAKQQVAIQVFCESRRDDLTEGGKVKSANFVTGQVQWRQRPPSCRVTKVEAVIDMLKRLGLHKFLRVKEEINKDAILLEQAEVAGIAGITVVTGVEDFVVTPFEAEA